MYFDLPLTTASLIAWSLPSKRLRTFRQQEARFMIPFVVSPSLSRLVVYSASKKLRTREHPYDDKPSACLLCTGFTGLHALCRSSFTDASQSLLASARSCLHRGSLSRSTASTNMNQTSSRSHAIFTITLETRRPFKRKWLDSSLLLRTLQT